MKDQRVAAPATGPGPVAIRVWDLPTRLFHWALVVLVAVNLYTGNVGGVAEMDWHMRSGYAILALLLFRIAWGFAGSTHSRFASFVRGPRAVLAYARGLVRGGLPPSVGHNPMGGWSVLALLFCLLLQGATGLFADDAILTRGPLADTVSDPVGRLLTAIHTVNAKLLYALIGLHLAAILFHQLVKRENLVRAMVTGRARVAGGPAAAGRWASPLLALVLLAAAAAAVWWVVDR